MAVNEPAQLPEQLSRELDALFASAAIFSGALGRSSGRVAWRSHRDCS